MRLTLYFDGACEPRNPGGVATYGWVLYDSGANELGTGHGLAFNGGPMATNNVAEYYALGFGLAFTADYLRRNLLAGCTLAIAGDSKLVVEQVSGNWRCNKPHLIALRDRCRLRLSELGIPWTIGWVPRERNARADELSKLAYFEATGKQPPERRKKGARV